MKPNILKLLIILNIFVFIVSLGIIYQRSSQIDQSYLKRESINVSSGDVSNTEIKNLQQQKIEKEFENYQTQQINDTLDQQNVISQQTLQTSSSSLLVSTKLRRPKFVYFSSTAKKVSLIGDFNNWIPQQMKKVNTKKWELIVEIPEGRYHYNFLVDGRPVLDPNNKKPSEISKQGFKSSVLELK
ncbi:MAG: glycogen-binding domain-containing protein [Endomicrobiia bacterium]